VAPVGRRIDRSNVRSASADRPRCVVVIGNGTSRCARAERIAVVEEFGLNGPVPAFDLPRR
jgi:hypothetical protein